MIDHAWTYKLNEARTVLSSSEKLLDRMSQLMNLSVSLKEDKTLNGNLEETLKHRKVELVLESMWKYNQTYKLYTDKFVRLKI